ncbi:MAG: M20/M25/M40 family metallo-hydrolase [Candidatus Hydrogenedentes bacterium]|nr:M20/M25/M40 family metallo-hydrolase [Candidatus Hydrogenedentota bacterium]
MFEKRTPFFYAAVSALFAVALAFYAVWSQCPPGALPADAPPGQFSAHRAIEHAFACSMKLHPAGSKNNDAVAAYFLETLRGMGVEAEFMAKTVVGGGNVELQQAVIGRIPGTDNTGSIAFSAHYDSVPYGPGATDDIAGCVAMIEAARAFMSLPRMRNDLLFIFADAEEIGGYGASGFCTHPLAENVGVITALDVRGVSGPALIYEFSEGNGALITELRRARRHGILPVTSSLMFSFFEAAPFRGDFSRFRAAGMKGYGLAYIDNFMWYHTANDSPENMNPDSVQHFGSFIMGISKHFGDADFADIALQSQNEIFFNTLGSHLVQYPLWLGMPLALLSVVSLLAVTVLGFWRGRITVAGYVLSLLLFPVTALLCALLALLMFMAVFGYDNVIHLYAVQPTHLPGPRALYDGSLYSYAVGLMTLGVAAWIYSLASRRLRVEALHAASLAWLCPLLLVISFYVPDGSYLLTWPVLFGALGLAALYRGDAKPAPASPRLFVATLFAVPALCLLPPAWHQLMWMISILGAPVLALVVVLFLLNLMPLMALLGRVRRSWMVCAGAAVAAAVLLCAGLVISGTPSKDRPLMNSVAYAANLDTGEAAWMSEDGQVDEWTRQFFPDGHRAAVDDLRPGTRGHHYLRAAAPVAEALTGVRCEVLKDETVGAVRRLTVMLTTDDAPFSVELRQTGGPPITAATVAGQPLDLGGDTFRIHFSLFAQSGYEATFETVPDEALTFEVFSRIYGFPEIPGVVPRPEYMVPEPNTIRNGISLRGEHIYLRNSFTLPAGPLQ